MKFVGKLMWRLYSTKIILLSKVAWLQIGESHVLVHLLVGGETRKEIGQAVFTITYRNRRLPEVDKCWGAETEENQHAVFGNAIMKADPLYVNLRLERQPSS